MLTPLCFGNYSLPPLTAESFLHFYKAVEGSNKIEGRWVVIASLPLISLCTPCVVQLCEVPNKAPKVEWGINTDLKGVFFLSVFLGYQFLILVHCAAVQWESIRMGRYDMWTHCHKNKCSTKWGLSQFIIQASKLVHYIGCAVLKLLKKPYLHSKYANLGTQTQFIFYLVQIHLTKPFSFVDVFVATSHALNGFMNVEIYDFLEKLLIAELYE